ncbi:Uncharacterised protein [Mycobacterium tuberculosis]|nr:Uncharacterised protein [Mycobacterium tuberculosis]
MKTTRSSGCRSKAPSNTRLIKCDTYSSGQDAKKSCQCAGFPTGYSGINSNGVWPIRCVATGSPLRDAAS